MFIAPRPGPRATVNRFLIQQADPLTRNNKVLLGTSAHQERVTGNAWRSLPNPVRAIGERAPDTSEQALYIEQEIEKYLEIEYAPVRGEISR